MASGYSWEMDQMGVKWEKGQMEREGVNQKIRMGNGELVTPNA